MTGLKVLRHMKNLKQAELAKAVGVSVVMMCRYENGQSWPSKEILLKVADELECSLDDLIRPSWASSSVAGSGEAGS